VANDPIRYAAPSEAARPRRSLADRLIVIVLLLNLAILAALIGGALLAYHYLNQKVDSLTGQLNGTTEQLHNSSSQVENRLDDALNRFR